MKNGIYKNKNLVAFEGILDMQLEEFDKLERAEQEKEKTVPKAPDSPAPVGSSVADQIIGILKNTDILDKQDAITQILMAPAMTDEMRQIQLSTAIAILKAEEPVNIDSINILQNFLNNSLEASLDSAIRAKDGAEVERALQPMPIVFRIEMAKKHFEQAVKTGNVQIVSTLMAVIPEEEKEKLAGDNLQFILDSKMLEKLLDVITDESAKQTFLNLANTISSKKTPFYKRALDASLIISLIEAIEANNSGLVSGILQNMSKKLRAKNIAHHLPNALIRNDLALIKALITPLVKTELSKAESIGSLFELLTSNKEIQALKTLLNSMKSKDKSQAAHNLLTYYVESTGFINFNANLDLFKVFLGAVTITDALIKEVMTVAVKKNHLPMIYAVIKEIPQNHKAAAYSAALRGMIENEISLENIINFLNSIIDPTQKQKLINDNFEAAVAAGNKEVIELLLDGIKDPTQKQKQKLINDNFEAAVAGRNEEFIKIFSSENSDEKENLLSAIEAKERLNLVNALFQNPQGKALALTILTTAIAIDDKDLQAACFKAVLEHRKETKKTALTNTGPTSVRQALDALETAQGAQWMRLMRSAFSVSFKYGIIIMATSCTLRFKGSSKAKISGSKQVAAKIVANPSTLPDNMPITH